MRRNTIVYRISVICLSLIVSGVLSCRAQDSKTLPYLAYKLWTFQPLKQKVIYKITHIKNWKHSSLVYHYAKLRNLDPLLVHSIIFVESYSPWRKQAYQYARNKRSNARCYMQVMPVHYGGPNWSIYRPHKCFSLGTTILAAAINRWGRFRPKSISSYYTGQDAGYTDWPYYNKVSKEYTRLVRTYNKLVRKSSN